MAPPRVLKGLVGARTSLHAAWRAHERRIQRNLERWQDRQDEALSRLEALHSTTKTCAQRPPPRCSTTQESRRRASLPERRVSVQTASGRTSVSVPAPRRSLVSSVAWQLGSNGSLRRHINQTVKETSSNHAPWDPVMTQTIELKQQGKRQELIASLLILMNAIYLGWQVHFFSVNGDELPHSRTVSAVFCCLFVLELFARACRQKKDFFSKHERAWNTFDVAVVLLNVVEEIATVIESKQKYAEVSILRTLRLFRLVRAFRMFRVLAFFFEFRVLIHTIECSLAATMWMVVACVLVFYIIGLVLTDGVGRMCSDKLTEQVVCYHFGTLDSSILSLYQAVSGGMLWGDVLNILEPMGDAYQALFLVFVSFTSLILFNIITALILHKTQEAGLCEREAVIQDELKKMKQVIHSLHNIFQEIDLNNSGAVSLEELQLAAMDPRMSALLSSLKLDINDLRALFNLLDRDRMGAIPLDDFLQGCMRLRGGAKAFDIVKVQVQCEWVMHNVAEMRHTLGEIEDKLAAGRAGAAAANAEQAAEQAAGGAAQAAEEAAGPPVVRIRTPSRATVATSLSMRSRLEGFQQRRCRAVPKAEERATSVAEMRQLREMLHACCCDEAWVELETGFDLSPADVNLYQYDYHCLSPATALGGAVLHGLAAGSWAEGDAVVQVDLDQPGHLPLAEGIAGAPGASGAGLPIAGVRCGKFRSAQDGKRWHVMVAGRDFGVPQHVETPGAVSIHELIGQGPRKPTWYCSHCWGGKVLDLFACCEEHACRRQLPEDVVGYWICAFANRQHDLESEIGGDLENVAFKRALRAAQGLLLVLDMPEATPFNRIWCDFELHETLMEKKLLDIVTKTEGSEGAVHLLSDGDLPGEPAIRKSLRERDFPITLLAKGMQVQLESGSATVEEDRRRILRFIESKHGRLEEALRVTNQALRTCFVRAAWPQAVKRGLVTDFDNQQPGALSLPSVLAQHEGLQTFSLSLAHFKEVNDHEVLALARGLPPYLQEVRLSFEGCPNLSDAGVQELALRLPPSLRCLQLDFLGCSRLTDLSLEALSAALPAGLQELRLDFAMCQEVSERGLRCLSDSLPSRMQRFSATFSGTRINRNFKSAAELRASRLLGPSGAKRLLSC